MSGYKAIGFIRQGGSGRLEVFTSTNAGTVTTQQTAISTTNKFSAGAYAGVAVVAAWLYDGCQVTNFANNISTRIKSYGSRTVIVGSSYENNPELLDRYGVVVLTNTAGANNNLDIEDFNYIVLASATGGFSITGLANGAAGKTVTLQNDTAQVMTIANQSGSSEAPNRIVTGTGGNLPINGPGSVTLKYDSNLSRWNVTAISKASPGGTVDSIVAGTGISVNATDPANPIVSATGVGSKIVFMGGTDDTTGDRYLNPNGISSTALAQAAVDPSVAPPVPFAGTVGRLFIKMDVAAGVGGDTFTVFKNGVATTLTATILEAATTASDTTHTFDVVAGDTITVKQGTLSGTGSFFGWGFQLVAT